MRFCFFDKLIVKLVHSLIDWNIYRIAFFGGHWLRYYVRYCGFNYAIIVILSSVSTEIVLF